MHDLQGKILSGKIDHSVVGVMAGRLAK